ncbi:MAG: hypothetical protein V4463_14495 [Pseudomonadota bacterium]
MNITMIDHMTFAQTLEESQILDVLDGPGSGQTFLCARDGADILIVHDVLTGDAMVIAEARSYHWPCSIDRQPRFKIISQWTCKHV